MRPDLIGGEGYLQNCWYVAGRSEDFGRELTALTMLEEQIVIYRDTQGMAIALEDACPHRKLPLSRGTIEGDHVVCGYHGLTFDCSGECVIAPTQLDNPPRRAAVQSYPAEDRWGFLWLWMGDPEQADRGRIIDIPNFDNPSWGKTQKGAMEMACHYLYITDNLLDPSHVAWVHLTSFAGAGTDNRPLDLEETEDGVIVSRWVLDEAPPPYYKDMLPFGPTCDRKQHYECRLPATAINMSVYAPQGEGGKDVPQSPNAFVNISYNFITPVDGGRSRYFWFQHRNMHAGDAALSQRMFDGAIMAFTEDKEVLEYVQTGMAKRKTPYINLGLDAGAMRFRTRVARQIKSEAG
ncbi:aromatic ring-hydroxylating dioxygenase subunit alpha [Leisingera sp. M658]|uniref:aromatic ring-hydroxylating dioxygenase subunit alpha n=1 Tax=Leisingera sp. M658 TaxID=2867015 RepID=UPI0021A68C8C|nr:aromatic ring-hydroxylating dioxygenase subunit alpha [Leisingera sp. M658]UWQ77152.1 aromatic ring-hydroxylating dioxygenase subunit alpha [Leisingera sp. M658]